MLRVIRQNLNELVLSLCEFPLRLTYCKICGAKRIAGACRLREYPRKLFNPAYQSCLSIPLVHSVVSLPGAAERRATCFSHCSSVQAAQSRFLVAGVPRNDITQKNITQK